MQFYDLTGNIPKIGVFAQREVQGPGLADDSFAKWMLGVLFGDRRILKRLALGRTRMLIYDQGQFRLLAGAKRELIWNSA